MTSVSAGGAGERARAARPANRLQPLNGAPRPPPPPAELLMVPQGSVDLSSSSLEATDSLFLPCSDWSLEHSAEVRPGTRIGRPVAPIPPWQPA